jgi:hypothetical protein
MMAAPAIIKKNVKSIKKYKIEFITLTPLNPAKKVSYRWVTYEILFHKKVRQYR